MEFIQRFVMGIGLFELTVPSLIMMTIALILLYVGIVKKHEPLLLVPISIAMIMANMPMPEILNLPGFSAYDAPVIEYLVGVDGVITRNVVMPGGLMYFIYQGIYLIIFPPLIFLCLGAMTDFGPVLSRPTSVIIGLGGQLGIIVAFAGALLLSNILPNFIEGFYGFDVGQAAAIGKIGSSDGPTVIFLASNLAPDLLPIIAIAGYSYMALVPAIQMPIMKWLTTDKERVIVMPPPPKVSKKVKILFPIVTTVVTLLLIPAAGALVGMMMLGNLIRECGVTDRYVPTLEMHLLNVLTILIGLAVGASATAEAMLNITTILVVILGLLAFAFGTAGGVLIAKVLCVVTGGKVNPLIGNAALSAMPMAARVSQKMGQRYNPENHLLMHAMGPTVASTIISAIAAGVFLALFGG
ncbi:MAG: sodium ion-translocating decarboxylase subunit beta [Defluviitaleaceae bacterium]|nr:sodium ion-translocating decarboxylase subunit beta [Defluviitaleaceae bacterium]